MHFILTHKDWETIESSEVPATLESLYKRLCRNYTAIKNKKCCHLIQQCPFFNTLIFFLVIIVFIQHLFVCVYDHNWMSKINTVMDKRLLNPYIHKHKIDKLPKNCKCWFVKEKRNLEIDIKYICKWNLF